MTEARSPMVRQSLLHAERLLFRGVPLLLVGEPGTGKEYIARYLHLRVFGSERELVRIDCSDPHVSTVIARGSAILFARFDLLSPQLQTDLLQSAGEAGAAVIATSEVESLPGFAEESRIRIPPLRERREDIEPLTCTFLSELSGGKGPAPLLTAEAISALLLYEWPGNLRELFETISSAVKRSAGGVIDLRHLPPPVAESLQPAPPNGLFKRYVRSAELLLIRWALRTCGDDRTKAARFLGLSRAALYKKLKLYPEFRVSET